VLEAFVLGTFSFHHLVWVLYKLVRMLIHGEDAVVAFQSFLAIAPEQLVIAAKKGIGEAPENERRSERCRLYWRSRCVERSICVVVISPSGQNVVNILVCL
jgi:hypothetical protein